jgi:hypothetical protein
MRTWSRGEVLPSYYVNEQDRFLSSLEGGLRIDQLSATTIRVPAGTDDDVTVSLTIDGRWRRATANVDRAHPGGAAGSYSIWAVAADNVVTNSPDPNTDYTDYDFELRITSGVTEPTAVPGSVEIWSRIGELDWSGTAITEIRQIRGSNRNVGPDRPTASYSAETPLSVAGVAGQTAALLAVSATRGGSVLAQISPSGGFSLTAGLGKTTLALTSASANTGLTLGGDTTLYRSASGVLKTDARLEAVTDLVARSGGAQVLIGSVSGNAGLSLGTAGDTTLFRDSAGALKTPGSFDAASLLIGGTALAASHLSNGTTGAGAVVLAGGPTLTGTPLAPTAAVNTNTTQIATTAFVVGQAATAAPLGSGTPAAGTSLRYARADHVHPPDTGSQPLDPTLTALAAFNTNGLLTQTAADTFTGRTLTGTANQVLIADGDGVAGNPTFSLPQSIHTSAGVAFASVALTGGASTSTLLLGKVTADSVERFLLTADGKMQWGDGSGAKDVSLYRATADVLGLDDAFRVTRGASNNTAFSSLVTADTDPRFVISAGGGFSWGPGNSAADVTLYRGGVDLLKTDDALSVVGAFRALQGTANEVSVTGANSRPEVFFGSAADSSIYRDSANSLTTPGAWNVTGLTTLSGGVIAPYRINAQTGTSYTLVLSDQQKLITLTNASAITLTVPPNSSVAFPIGTVIEFIQGGAGQVTFAAGAGVTLAEYQSKTKLAGQYAGATMIKIAADTWWIVGNLA